MFLATALVAQPRVRRCHRDSPIMTDWRVHLGAAFNSRRPGPTQTSKSNYGTAKKIVPTTGGHGPHVLTLMLILGWAKLALK